MLLRQKYNFDWLNDFRRIMFPKFCVSCNKVLIYREKDLCLGCIISLPRTGYHHLEENPVSVKLEGRIPIENATAFLLFEQGGTTQNVLHHIKYRNGTDLAQFLGRIFARDLTGTPFSQSDVIVPVPLHPKKQKLRGYNQSACIGLGISSVWNIDMSEGNLVRRIATQTQTKKTRIMRWENVSAAFELRDPAYYRGKEVLLVDDVITTGATLEACAVLLYQAGVKALRIATLASA